MKDIRQEWQDHQLGRKTSDIILYDQFMDRKLEMLVVEVGKSASKLETYYLDNATGHKWINESHSEIYGGPRNCEKCSNFLFEQAQ